MSPATATETKSVSLINISTEKWPPRQRTYFGSLSVHSLQPGEPYAITPVHSCRGVMDLGDNRIHEIFISAQEIAEDLAREMNGDSGEGSFHGILVAAGPEPTEAELADARQLGLEKPWLYDPKPMAECPACVEKIKPGVAVCPAARSSTKKKPLITASHQSAPAAKEPTPRWKPMGQGSLPKKRSNLLWRKRGSNRSMRNIKLAF